jgi:dephospho-CoA kinase
MRNLTPKFKLLNQSKRLYEIANPLIGLTGGIATGKSAVANLLRENGQIVLDADKLVHNVYASLKTKEFIKDLAPTCTTGDGENINIDFKELRKLFFSDKEIKKKVETHIYSKLPQAFLDSLKDVSSDQVVFYDVPLLFEKELNKKTDLNVVVYASQKIQIERVMVRDQIEKELAQKIIFAQIPIDDKKQMADIVLSNEGSLADLKSEVELFLNTNFS